MAYIQILMYRNLDFLVKSASVAVVLLVSVLMFLLLRPKIVAIFGWKKITLKHLAAVILLFLLQLKVILCTF